jgi:hypothetical protein
MRNLAGPLGFAGAALSLVFWTVVPLTGIGGSTYLHSGQEAIIAALVVLSVAGIAGALLSRVTPVFAALLMGLAMIPGLAALAVPGVLLFVAALFALAEPEPQRRTPVT